MLRSYDEAMSTRRAQLHTDVASQGVVLERTYQVAMEVVVLRLRHGLTQAELAERCGMDEADISRIERGSTDPSVLTLQRLAEALDADVRLVSRGDRVLSRRPHSLAEMLSRVAPDNLHTEFETGRPVGNETW